MTTKTTTRTNGWLIAAAALFVIPSAIGAGKLLLEHINPPLPQHGYKAKPADTTPAAATPTPAPSAAQAAVNDHEVTMRWACEDSIKSQLRDPRSYEVEKVSYLPSAENSSGAIVSTVIVFRSRNGFGGMSPAIAACGFNSSGELVSAAAIANLGA
jgi:hypothetical protein